MTQETNADDCRERENVQENTGRLTDVTDLWVSTDKAYVSGLPRYLYEGPIAVIVGEEEAQRAVDVLRRSSLLGIDTETRPSFHKGEHHRVALLQVASDEVCYLFRLCRIGLPDCLVDLLSDEHILKVGLSLRDDFLMLRHRRDFQQRGCLDLQTYVAEMGIKDMSLQKLYANVFHQRISKNARLTNWEADALTDIQQRYAATDAVACISLYRQLKALRESGAYRLLHS